MPLKPQTLGAALHEELTLHTALCRREVGAYQQALQSGEEVVVACTQEQPLFVELAEQAGGHVAPVRFVNIRETGGWSRDAAQAGPKIAALLAAAHLPEPEPVPTVTYRSSGRLLIIGPAALAEQAADMAGEGLQITLFATGGQAAQARRPRALHLLRDFALPGTAHMKPSPELALAPQLDVYALVQAQPDQV